MNLSTETQPDSKSINESLADSFLKIGRYLPIFLLISSLGILVIYFLGRFRILGDPTPLLVGVVIPIGTVALLQQAVFVYLARRKQGIAAYFVSSALVAILAMSFVALWQGSIYFVIPVILIMPVAGVMAGMPRKNIFWLVLLVLVAIAGVLFLEKNFQDSGRLPFSSPASIASLAFLSATGLLLITITVISHNRSYRSLQSLLLVSFIVIVTIPTVMATILSGVGAYSNGQTQTYNTLKAITNLKENQITLLVNDIKSDANKIQSDARFKQNILPVLTTSDTDPGQMASHRTLARAFIVSIQKDKGTYTEILILDTKGTVVVSTDLDHINVDYQEQLFYRQGTVKFFSGFASLPGFGDQNFIVATPLFDTNGQTIRGVIVLRSDASAIERIMENTPGYTQAETYLVDKNFNPVTKTRTTTDTVRTKAALDAVIENIDGQATYQNYAEQEVLGYYKWYEPMQMAIIAEVPVQVVAETSLWSLLGSSILAILVIIIAIAAVVIAARSITEPIRELAQITESYTAGKFHVRASVNRNDEIGALASSYNLMATELQEIIGKLEQRVADRTKELENQTLRMRAAAEIARDAAATRDLGDLLESSARLILERFKLYHTGIFLIDKDREFVVLAASSTEAGKQMIANSFKIRMGEVDIVGRVASTGEPRISQDLGDGINFNQPLLPRTQSEMALPLKVGNTMIGVLDVHSEQSIAFTQDDIAILQTMADQLATAIERTQLLQEVEYNLKELEKAYGQYTREGWQKLGSSGQLVNRGYRFDNIRIEPISSAPETASESIVSGKSESSNGKKTEHSFAIPIKLRGQTIGVINAKLKEGFNPKTVSTLQAATERLAVALESARLYEEARARADREQAIAQVTTKISSSTEFEAILRTTVEEIGKSISNSEVSIQILDNLDNQNPNS